MFGIFFGILCISGLWFYKFYQKITVHLPRKTRKYEVYLQLYKNVGSITNSRNGYFRYKMKSVIVMTEWNISVIFVFYTSATVFWWSFVNVKSVIAKSEWNNYVIFVLYTRTMIFWWSFVSIKSVIDKIEKVLWCLYLIL